MPHSHAGSTDDTEMQFIQQAAARSCSSRDTCHSDKLYFVERESAFCNTVCRRDARHVNYKHNYQVPHSTSAKLEYTFSFTMGLSPSDPTPCSSGEYKFRHPEYKFTHPKYSGISSDTQSISSDTQDTAV